MVVDGCYALLLSLQLWYYILLLVQYFRRQCWLAFPWLKMHEKEILWSVFILECGFCGQLSALSQSVYDILTVEPLILATLTFGVSVNVIILDPVILAFFASYYTETLLYSSFHGPLFSRTCQAREIRKIKGTRKNGFYSVCVIILKMLICCREIIHHSV